MAVVEQNIIVRVPKSVVMDALNDVKSIPSWATVSGTIDNVQGSGPGMTYEWHYAINKMSFNGKSEVLEQSESSLITKTTGDVDSLWTITLTPAGKDTTAVRVVVEYSPPNIFIELLADLVLEQMSDPKVARENATRFKEMVEARANVLNKQTAA